MHLFTALDPIESSSLCTVLSHDGACHAFLHLESLHGENSDILQASLTKIERPEVILSIEYSIIFIAVFADKLQN